MEGGGEAVDLLRYSDAAGQWLRSGVHVDVSAHTGIERLSARRVKK